MAWQAPWQALRPALRPAAALLTARLSLFSGFSTSSTSFNSNIQTTCSRWIVREGTRMDVERWLDWSGY
jgi:hypothetical protein